MKEKEQRKRLRGQYAFVGLLMTFFAVLIFAAIYPSVTNVVNPVITGMDNDLAKMLFQLVLPTLLLGILTHYFFLSSPSGG